MFRIRYINEFDAEVQEVLPGKPPEDPAQKFNFWLARSKRRYLGGPMYLPATMADRFHAVIGWLKRALRITKKGKES